MALALAVAASAVVATCEAGAQDVVGRAQDAVAAWRPSRRDVYDLARTLLAEADGHVADWRPILSVLGARALRVGADPASVARRYSRLHRSTRPTARMREILALPDAMPARRRGQWSAALAVASEWCAQYTQSHAATWRACAATHWGAPRGADYDRAVRAGWARVDCGATANAFWREPW